MTKTILVVEDDKTLATAIKSKLETMEFEVMVASTVDQAMALLSNNDIKAVWLDHYLLGKENGLDLVTKLKEEDSQWHNIPVFVVSNTASEEKVKSYLGLGVSKYYTKADNRLEDIINEINQELNV